MNAIYFSGTGNTRHCAEKAAVLLGGKAASIEEAEARELLKNSEQIIFAYPIQFSNMPLIVKNFIECNKSLFAGKQVFIICTMGLFSGDGAGLAARLLKRCGAKVTGGLHLRYPDCIGDEKMLKKTVDENLALIKLADAKLEKCVNGIKNGRFTKDGLSVFCFIAGLFGQRLWFLAKAKRLGTKLCINTEKCTGCSKCAQNCPSNSIKIIEGKAVFLPNKCTTCYRCVNNCPAKAITLLGKQVWQQCTFDNYFNHPERVEKNF